MTVVTGAPNMLPYVGQDLSGGKGPKVAYAMSGARLIDGHSEERRIVRLKPSKIRGIVSEGMVCSEKELDLSDSHEGNLVLPADAPVGMPLVDYMGDVVLDYDVKGAFGHLQCIYGAAREVAALTGKPLRRDVMTILERQPVTDHGRRRLHRDRDRGARPVPALLGRADRGRDGRAVAAVDAAAAAACRACGRSTTSWTSRTTSCSSWGSRCTRSTTTCCASAARPVAGRVARPHIIMRRAHAGRTHEDAGRQDRLLDPEMLMITDTAGSDRRRRASWAARRPRSATAPRTILLESANFNFLSIRRTSQMLGLRSEAASRFGKRVDPELTVKALARAVPAARAAGRRQDSARLRRQLPRPARAEADRAGPGLREPPARRRPARGRDGPHPARRSSSPWTARARACSVGVPSHRQDVNIPADLVEEIGRIYGYDRLPATLLQDELPQTQRNVRAGGAKRRSATSWSAAGWTKSSPTR